MSACKEDVLKSLKLLEEYRARLEGTNELALCDTISSAIAAIRSTLFTALLDIREVHVASLELSKAVQPTKQTGVRGPLVYTSPSPSSSVPNASKNVVIVNSFKEPSQEPTTNQDITDGNLLNSTSCEQAATIKGNSVDDGIPRSASVTDSTPPIHAQANASAEAVVPLHNDGAANHGAEKGSAECVTCIATSPRGATEAVPMCNEQTVNNNELKSLIASNEQKPTGRNEQDSERRCDDEKGISEKGISEKGSEQRSALCVVIEPPSSERTSEEKAGDLVTEEQKPVCNGGQNSATSDEQKPVCNGGQNSATSDEQKPVCNGGEEKHLSAEEQKILKAAMKRYNIAKEFMDTEAKYVDRLKIISDFLGLVNDFDANNKRVIPDLSNRLMFQHVKEMYELNGSLLKRLQDCMEMWKTREELGVVLREYAPKLKVYCLYAAGYEDAIKAITDWSAKDKKFDILVKEFDEKMGDGAGGGFITRCMLEPVLRILRYRLLLAEYIKYGVKGSSEMENSEVAQTVISEAANESNSRIDELKNCNEVLAIQRSINGSKSLLVPGRSFIKKGELLKQSRKTAYSRMFFLFSDILLHTDLCIGLGQSFKIKDELSVWGMKVEEPIVPPLPHCFIVTSVRRSLILSASSGTEKQEWMKALRGAIDSHQKKAFATLKTLPTLTGDFGSCAPIMVPDKNVTMCQLCAEVFTTTFRRHHCRACGKVVCGNCSQKKAFLAYNSKFERVCDICYSSSTRRRANSYQTAIDSDPQEDVTDSLKNGHHSVLLDDSDILYTKGFDTTAAVAGYVWIMDKKRPTKMWYHVKQDFVLYKFKAHEDVKAVASLPLPGYLVKPDIPTASISLLHESIERQLVVHETFKLDNPADIERWISVLCKATQLQAVPTAS